MVKDMLEIYDEVTLLHEQAERAAILQGEINVDFLQAIDSRPIIARDGLSRIQSAADVHKAVIKGAIVEDILDNIVIKLAELKGPLNEYVEAEAPAEAHEAKDVHTSNALHEIYKAIDRIVNDKSDAFSRLCIIEAAAVILAMDGDEFEDEHSKELFEALHQLHARNLAHEYIRQLNAIAWHMVSGDKITVNVDITAPTTDK